MRSGTSHDLNKMPVFFGGVCVTLNVADQLTIGLSSGIKAKRALNILVFQISVNGLGAANDLYASVVGGKILG